MGRSALWNTGHESPLDRTLGRVKKNRHSYRSMSGAAKGFKTIESLEENEAFVLGFRILVSSWLMRHEYVRHCVRVLLSSSHSLGPG